MFVTEGMTYSMLPSINSQQWFKLANHRILVGICLDTNVSSLSVLDKPCPTTALNASQSSVEFLLHIFKTSICALDLLCQSTGRWFTTTGVLWCKVLPEQGVIQVPTTVEIDEWLQSNLCSNIVVGLCSSELVSCIVVAVHIGLMMLAVVKLHDLTADGWLESAIVVLKVCKVSVKVREFISGEQTW